MSINELAQSLDAAYDTLDASSKAMLAVYHKLIAVIRENTDQEIAPYINITDKTPRMLTACYAPYKGVYEFSIPLKDFNEASLAQLRGLTSGKRDREKQARIELLEYELRALRNELVID